MQNLVVWYPHGPASVEIGDVTDIVNEILLLSVLFSMLEVLAINLLCFMVIVDYFSMLRSLIKSAHSYLIARLNENAPAMELHSLRNASLNPESILNFIPLL